MKLVKFKDGTYGVRKMVWFEFMYLDLTDPSHWWTINCSDFNNCKGSKEEAEKGFIRVTDYGTPINKVLKENKYMEGK